MGSLRLRPGPKGKSGKVERPAIPDSDPPIFIESHKGGKTFSAELPKFVWLRIGGAIPKDTASVRTVTLTPEQAFTLGEKLKMAAVKSAPGRRRGRPPKIQAQG